MIHNVVYFEVKRTRQVTLLYQVSVRNDRMENAVYTDDTMYNKLYLLSDGTPLRVVWAGYYSYHVMYKNYIGILYPLQGTSNAYQFAFRYHGDSYMVPYNSLENALKYISSEFPVLISNLDIQH